MNSLLFWVGLVLPGPPPAMLHASLESTAPVAGDTIAAYPKVIRLNFSEPIEDEFSELVLTDGNGKITKLKPHTDPYDVKALIADFPAITPGGYLVVWRVVSADGHPVGGHFVFYSAVGGSLAGTPPPPPPPSEHPEEAAAGLTGEPPILAAIVRGAALGALMALTGLLVVLCWIVPESRQGALARLERSLLFVTPVLLAGDFYLWLQHASSAGSVDADAIVSALGTQNGLIYAARVALGLAAVWAMLAVRHPKLAVVFSAASLLITSATGHPAAIHATFAVPGKAIHLAGSSVWLGGLLVLILGRQAGDHYTRDAHRISTLALVAVISVAVTGLVETLLFLRPIELLTSAYGRMVLGKIAGLLGLVAFGAWHKYRVLPRLAAGAPDSALRRSVAWETGLMGATVILAAFLAYVSPPAPPGAMASEHHHMSAPAPTGAGEEP